MSSTQTYHRSDNAEAYRSNAAFVYSSAYTAAVLELLDAQPGEKVLDLGCGSGELTLQLARAVGATGYVLGQDASADMIDKAQALHTVSTTAGCEMATTEFVVRDAHDALAVELHGRFDKVFSNAALHWMKRSPSVVLSHIYSALRPGGSFAAELGGFMNCIALRGHLHTALRRRGFNPVHYDPWFFPSAAEYTELLQDAGFIVEHCELVPRLTPLPAQTGIKGWLHTFAGPFLNAIDDVQDKENLVAEVQEALRPDCFHQKSSTWSVMYVRLRVLARKPQ